MSTPRLNELWNTARGARATVAFAGAAAALLLGACFGADVRGPRCFDSSDCPLGWQCTASRVCVAGPPLLRPGQRPDAGPPVDARADGDASTSDGADDALALDAQNERSSDDALAEARVAPDGAIDAAIDAAQNDAGVAPDSAVDARTDASVTDAGALDAAPAEVGDAADARDGAEASDAGSLVPSDAFDASTDGASAAPGDAASADADAS